jgi:AcrR family transcriptional regulator
LSPRPRVDIEPSSIERRLTDRQRQKREAILAAAYELADEVPYEDFSTREVAARAGVALGTLYHYFATKDHLIAVATLSWLAEFDEELAKEPIRSRSTAQRIMDLLGRQSIRARTRPELYRSLARAILSGDAATKESTRIYTDYTARWFEIALGDADVGDRQAVLDLLAALTLTTLISASNRDLDSPKRAKRLEAAIRQILSN